MTPLEWAKHPLFKYADFTGRASRPEYWWYMLANMAALAIAGAIDSVLGLNTMLFGAYGPFTAGLGIGLLPPSLTASVRRLHDTSRSGWWLLLALVPFAGAIVIYFLALEGTPCANAFGPPCGVESGPGTSL